MEERKVKELETEEERVKEAEFARILDLEKPAPDELYGMRVHCWVLVLAGRREVTWKGKGFNIVSSKVALDINIHSPRASAL